MNLDDITRQSEFNFDTSAFGTVRVGVLSTYDIDAVERSLDLLTPFEIAQLLFDRLARPTAIAYEDHEAQEPPTKHFDAYELSEQEVEDFAQQICRNYRYLSSCGKDKWLEKSIDESYTEFLSRIFTHDRDRQVASRVKLVEPVSSAIFSDANRRKWAGSALANARLDPHSSACATIGTSQTSRSQLHRLRMICLESSVRNWMPPLRSFKTWLAPS